MSVRTRFAEKVVLIIGGNSGIGLACAKAFAAEGARVALTGREAATLERARLALGSGALVMRADLADTSGHGTVVEQVRKTYGRVDVLFANAGTGVRRSITRVSEHEWDATMSTNLKGHYFMIQSVLPLMSSGAAIVINSSVAVSRPRTGNSVYAASKAALSSLTVSLGAELLPKGIRVNAVSPGPIDTPLHTRVAASQAAVRIFKNQVAAGNPMKRWGTPEEVAHAVLFLASDEASFITGATLPVDGGAGCF
jgi:NAD(P)-dependent dehydrogenase (short-subunit alcohol dehydrogenase family)